MLIEQITEFQLTGPGASGRACTPITSLLFSWKNKNLYEENIRVDYYLLLKYGRRQWA